MAFPSRSSCIAVLLPLVALACAKPPTRVVQFEYRDRVLAAQHLYVERHPGDERNYAAILRDEIAGYGLDVRSGAPGSQPEGTDVLVRFTDRYVWQWSTYLASMAVMLYDAESQDLLVAGRAESMDKVAPETLIHEAVASIFDELQPAAARP